MIKVVVYTAPWCSSCKPFKEQLRQFNHEQIELVDIDENPEAGAKANIRTVPLSIVYKDDEELERHIGAVQVPFLIGRIEEHELQHSTPDKQE